MNRAPLRILLIRLDRIGDLILTLPVDTAFGGARIDWWVPENLGFIAEMSVPRRQAREVSRKIGVRGFFALLRQVRDAKYSSAIVFHAPWWVSCLLWLARVPVRGGVRSQWHSFLFLNRSIRQKRSLAEHSELEYNFKLVEEIMSLPKVDRVSLRLKGQEGGARTSLFARFGLHEGAYTVVHPGMGGSALNWPTEHYAQLIREVAREGKVAVTGTAADEAYLAPLLDSLSDLSNVVWLDGKLNGPELITVLGGARVVVAPSTGVLHLAASSGRPTIGLFSPVRVQHPRRWGAQGQRARMLMPDVECPGELRCLGAECAKFDCMKSLEPEQVLRAMQTIQEPGVP